MEQPAVTSSHRHKEALAAMHSAAVSQPHRLEPDATPPYALLVLVKNGHVGSSWFASLVEKHEWMVGVHVWNLTDFRSTQMHIRAGGLNMKGLFTRDRQPKMAAHHIRKLWAAA